jgi:hypothetical protein
LHQVGGATYLVARSYPDRLCALVAHHSAATFEAAERSLLDAMKRWAADMTTGPRGAEVDYATRLVRNGGAIPRGAARRY